VFSKPSAFVHRPWFPENGSLVNRSFDPPTADAARDNAERSFVFRWHAFVSYSCRIWAYARAVSWYVLLEISQHPFLAVGGLEGYFSSAGVADHMRETFAEASHPTAPKSGRLPDHMLE
jgi:hypothetical protein